MIGNFSSQKQILYPILLYFGNFLKIQIVKQLLKKIEIGDLKKQM